SAVAINVACHLRPELIFRFSPGEDCAKTGLEVGELPGDDEPDCLEVDTEIVVNDNISDSHNFPPGDLGVPLPNRPGHLSACLPDDLEVTYHCIDGFLVPEEVLL